MSGGGDPNVAAARWGISTIYIEFTLAIFLTWLLAVGGNRPVFRTRERKHTASGKASGTLSNEFNPSQHTPLSIRGS